MNYDRLGMKNMRKVSEASFGQQNISPVSCINHFHMGSIHTYHHQLWVQSPYGSLTKELHLILVGPVQLRVFCGSVTQPHWDPSTWGFIHTGPVSMEFPLGKPTPSLVSNQTPMAAKPFYPPPLSLRINLKPTQPQPCTAQPRGIPHPQLKDSLGSLSFLPQSLFGNSMSLPAPGSAAGRS